MKYMLEVLTQKVQQMAKRQEEVAERQARQEERLNHVMQKMYTEHSHQLTASLTGIKVAYSIWD